MECCGVLKRSSVGRGAGIENVSQNFRWRKAKVRKFGCVANGAVRGASQGDGGAPLCTTLYGAS